MVKTSNITSLISDSTLIEIKHKPIEICLRKRRNVLFRLISYYKMISTYHWKDKLMRKVQRYSSLIIIRFQEKFMRIFCLGMVLILKFLIMRSHKVKLISFSWDNLYNWVIISKVYLDLWYINVNMTIQKVKLIKLVVK